MTRAPSTCTSRKPSASGSSNPTPRSRCRLQADVGGAPTLKTELAIDLPERAAPTLDAEALAELAPFGEERTVEAGDILYRAGDESYDFFVVLEGAVDIIRPDLDGETLITTHRGRR